MYIIAEIGINHNGSLETALQMIQAAYEAGADCVKFQKRNPDKCVPENQKSKIRIFQGKEMTYLDYKKAIEFEEKEYDIINKYCKDLGIAWTASVWDVDSVLFMKKYLNDIPFIKIPSACITDFDLLNAVNDLDIPVIISDGMSTFEEINKAINYLFNLQGILHCNSSYPSQNNELDLNVIKTYNTMYTDYIIGYSGHEIGYFPTLIAIAVGAKIVERHFTLDNNMEGTDQKSSLNPVDFKQMVLDISNVEDILGEYLPNVYPQEQEIKNKLRVH